MFARCMMIKQFVGEIRGPYCQFRVFETGDSKFYLFCALDENGIDHSLHIPVAKRRLSAWAKKSISRCRGRRR